MSVAVRSFLAIRWAGCTIRALTLSNASTVAGRRIRADTLAYAILVQVGLLLLTVFIVILRPSNPEDPAFEGKKTVRLPQREL